MDAHHATRQCFRRLQLDRRPDLGCHQAQRHRQVYPDWYPFQLDKMPAAVYVGLVCSARNDRNYAPMTKLPGKTADCRDPDSDLLRSRTFRVQPPFAFPTVKLREGW